MSGAGGAGLSCARFPVPPGGTRPSGPPLSTRRHRASPRSGDAAGEGGQMLFRQHVLKQDFQAIGHVNVNVNASIAYIPSIDGLPRVGLCGPRIDELFRGRRQFIGGSVRFVNVRRIGHDLRGLLIWSLLRRRHRRCFRRRLRLDYVRLRNFRISSHVDFLR